MHTRVEQIDKVAIPTIGQARVTATKRKMQLPAARRSGFFYN